MHFHIKISIIYNNFLCLKKSIKKNKKASKKLNNVAEKQTFFEVFMRHLVKNKFQIPNLNQNEL